MPSSSAPVETKVTAATITAAVVPFVLWLLAEYAFPDDEVPAPVTGVVVLLVTGLATFFAGYSARHTPRTDPAASKPDPVEKTGEGPAG